MASSTTQKLNRQEQFGAVACKAERDSSAPMSGGKLEVQRAFPPTSRQDVLKWNAWGYRDSGFFVNEKGIMEFAGRRYLIAGRELPRLQPLMAKYGLDTNLKSFSPPPPLDDELPKPILNPKFESAISSDCIKMSHHSMDRLMHSHGHTCRELFSLRTGKWGRLPDLVVWPANHEQVERIMKAAVECNVCLIPFGGGTNVSRALECPPDETRTIVSLDMTTMDKILGVDSSNLTVRVEAGMIGQDMEQQLRDRGYTTGHEPDSLEFSSVGGWVATRSSGMKKNIYGNIEDLIVHIRVVTPRGTMEKSFKGPRNSVGPDVYEFILGSEGILGVVTEVTLRIRPTPPVQRYGSIVFRDFDQGIEFMREVARQRCTPASVRLMDNVQFLMGQALKTPGGGIFGSLAEAVKKFYLTKFKGFDLETCAACTLLFEGTAEEVAAQEKKLYDISSQFGGLKGGSENGRYGYMMTFSIAYLRDLGFDYCFLGESFETSVPWDRVSSLVRNVKDRITREAERHNVGYPLILSARVTQAYDAGACVYFYLAFNYTGISDPLHTFEELEVAARDEILSSGGSLSHHHGVGKIRKQWVSECLSDTGVEMLRAVKERIDPLNIMGSGNLIPSLSSKL